MDWWPLLDGVGYGKRRSEILLVGDMCEAIQGRYLREFSSRSARKREYLLNLVGKTTPARKASPETFKNWKLKKADELNRAVLASVRHLADPLKMQCDLESISNDNYSDLESSFARITENMPEFEAMLDELWEWFHKVRFVIAGQCRLTASTFRTFCPALSMRFLRLISHVNPRFRTQQALVNAIAQLPDFKLLAQIPTAQIPWVGGRVPLVFKLALWGARSMADQFLIKRS